jgi:hypothetical protein
MYSFLTAVSISSSIGHSVGGASKFSAGVEAAGGLDILSTGPALPMESTGGAPPSGFPYAGVTVNGKVCMPVEYPSLAWMVTVAVPDRSVAGVI